MADKCQKLFPERATLIPRELDWQSLERLDGEPLDAIHSCLAGIAKPNIGHK